MKYLVTLKFSPTATSAYVVEALTPLHARAKVRTFYGYDPGVPVEVTESVPRVFKYSGLGHLEYARVGPWLEQPPQLKEDTSEGICLPHLDKR